MRSCEGLNAVQKPLLHTNMAKPRCVVGFHVTCSIEAYAYFFIINIINDIIFYKYSVYFLDFMLFIFLKLITGYYYT